MDIYQSNNYRKNLSSLYFDDEPRVQEGQQVKKQQSCISFFVAYLTLPSRSQEHQPRHDNSIPCKAVRQIYRDAEQPGERNFINESRLQYSWRQFQQCRQCKRVNPIQKRKTNLSSFLLKNSPIHFHINSNSVKRNQLSFSSIEINKPLLPQSSMSHRSDSSSEAFHNSSCYHRSDV